MPLTATAPRLDKYCSVNYGTAGEVRMSTIKAMTRVYTDPATGAHPPVWELLLDRLLLFTPK